MSDCKGNGKVKSNFVPKKKKRPWTAICCTDIFKPQHSDMWLQHQTILSSLQSRDFNFACDKESACNAGDSGSISGSEKIPWRRKQQPTPLFLPGELHGQRSLVGYSPWGYKELDRTERLTFSLSLCRMELEEGVL